MWKKYVQIATIKKKLVINITDPRLASSHKLSTTYAGLQQSSEISKQAGS